MTERSLVDLIEDWQTGFFVVVGSAVVGILVGTVLGFLAYSYLRYGG